MAYNTSKLQKKAECDQAIALANTRKKDLAYDQTVLQHGLDNKTESANNASIAMASVTAQIAGTEAAVAAMPDGPDKTKQQSKLRRLNDRKDNLNDTLTEGGNVVVLDTELEAKMISLQLAEIETYIAEVTTRKNALAS